jgi:toxin ParE1/3/4
VRKLVIRPEAAADLDAQALFIAADNVEAGLRLYASADRAFRRILQLPRIGAVREFASGRLQGLRVWPIPDFPNHLVFYRVTGAVVEVVRVLHAARDIPGALEEE